MTIVLLTQNSNNTFHYLLDSLIWSLSFSHTVAKCLFKKEYLIHVGLVLCMSCRNTCIQFFIHFCRTLLPLPWIYSEVKSRQTMCFLTQKVSKWYIFETLIIIRKFLVITFLGNVCLMKLKHMIGLWSIKNSYFSWVWYGSVVVVGIYDHDDDCSAFT